MRLSGFQLSLGGLVLGMALSAGHHADAASNCAAPVGGSTTCVVDANANNNALSGTSPTFVSSVTFAAGSTYVLTVQNPLTTTWQYDTNLAGVTADGIGSPSNVGALVGQIGGASSSPVTAGATGSTDSFRISIMGALVNGTTGIADNGKGVTQSVTTAGGTLTLAMQDSDTANNLGTQTVTITKAPTVGGLVLANVNVFAKANGLGNVGDPGGVGVAVATGVTLDASKNYRIEVTDPNHLWNASNLATDRISTANGLNGLNGVTSFQKCGAVANIYGETCAAGGTFGVGEGNSFYYGELIALIGGAYYGVGTGRNFQGLAGAVSLLYWDSIIGDNEGFMNVTLSQVPEPASLLLLGGGLAGLAWLRRRGV